MLGLLACGLLLAATTDEAHARKATPGERHAMLEAWNRRTGDPPECRNTWVTRVSKHRPRTGMIWANQRLRIERDCALGDGWALLRRPTPRSHRWRIVTEGSDLPPCSYVTPRMARELGFPACRR